MAFAPFRKVMRNGRWFVCFVVLWLTLSISNASGYGFDEMKGKITFMQDKMLDIDQTLQRLEAKQRVDELRAQENREKQEAKPADNDAVSQADLQTKLDELERRLKADNVGMQETLVHVQNSVTDLRSKLAVMEGKLLATVHTLQKKVEGLEQGMASTKKASPSNSEPVPIQQRVTMPVPLRQMMDEARNIANQSEFMYSSCWDAPAGVSGKFLVRPKPDAPPFEVYCEQTKYGGGWTVLQKRHTGQLDFYRNWTEYREGFGDLTGEFWLGLEKIHQITSQRRHELMVEVQDFDGNYRYAHYDSFAIAGEDEQYRLRTVGAYDGTAGDAMSYSVGQMFSTVDRNNGVHRQLENCAVTRRGAWWYGFCSQANLNGPYKRSLLSLSTMYWHFTPRDRRSLAYSRMMIRAVGENARV